MTDSIIKQISADQMVSFLKKQAADIGSVGDTNLFGETVTEDDIAHSISELSRVAALYAAELRSR